MRTMRRTSLLVAATIAAVLIHGVPAEGDDHLPPDVTLRVGERQQVGRSSSGYWASPIAPPQGAPPGTYCGAWTWDPAPYPYPSALRVPRGDVRARIVFQKTHRPESVSIRGWTVVEESGERRGPRSIGYSLHPVQEGDQAVAWIADVTLRVRKHLYLDVSAEWSDQEGMGCSGQRQTATWNFHVRARRS